MSRLGHLIALVLAAALGLGAGALLMLAFGRLWPAGDPTVVVVAALIVALLLPAAVGLASRKWIAGGQPLTAWLSCFATSIVLALSATLAL